MKQTIIISTLFIFLLSGCTTQTFTDRASSEGGPLTQESPQVHSEHVDLEGISFQAPNNYQYILEETSFTSFDEYAEHIESNLIKELIQSNKQNKLTEAGINDELGKFEGQYSFERKELNGFNLLIHRREFFGLVGDIYEAHIYLENGKILILQDELDHQRLDEVLSTIQKH